MKRHGMVWLGLVMAGQAWAQGSLAPPGAPGESLKTLTQVEPRTPISIAPYTITQPGSYCLTASLTSTTHGIVIEADGVTLDLMGFTLTGDRGIGDYGLWLAGASNATVRDITVRGGLISGFEYGVQCEYAQNCRMEGLLISSNLTHGIRLSGEGGACNGNTIANCTLGGNGNAGVYLYGYLGQCNGNTVRDCVIRGNNSYGIFFSGLSGQCTGNTIENCAISGNGNYGVRLYGEGGQCNGNTVRDSVLFGNNAFGIYLDAPFGQCDGNTVDRCVLRNNATVGIYIKSARGNRIQNNHVSGTTGAPSYGIYSGPSGGNLILQNSGVGQTYNFTMAPDDTAGPVVSQNGALATTNGAAALSPWANFSR